MKPTPTVPQHLAISVGLGAVLALIGWGCYQTYPILHPRRHQQTPYLVDPAGKPLAASPRRPASPLPPPEQLTAPPTVVDVPAIDGVMP